MLLWAARGSRSWITCLSLLFIVLFNVVVGEFERSSQPKRGNALLSRYGRAVLSRYGKRSAPSFEEKEMAFDENSEEWLLCRRAPNDRLQCLPTPVYSY
ncbi:unnamed protein product [Bursaphelenchus okinawaensis]|uniref:Uncharacterized protein n=1 Tax=Bursaphelenchus okinawaensis TaxID=465554 RepID=A0A811KJL5_9BILA|nr:unnamed protein product [Bursaphelenchus okinawaensis]CAG9105071.1 unnamed protein product [Bursaphelenchus okinawaensis]